MDAYKFRKIFAVDDNKKTLELIRLFFYENYKNIDLDIYSDPLLAYKRFKKQFYIKPYDLAIIDWKMPKITGECLSVMLKDVDPNIKTVLYTGSSDDMFLKHLHVYKLDAILNKKLGTNVLNEVSRLLNVSSFEKVLV